MNPLMIFFTGFLPWFDAILAFALIVGGVVAYRQGFSKASGETQEKTITAQGALITTLEARVDGLEREVSHLQGILETASELLKQKGMIVTVTGDVVTITETNGKTSSIRRRPPKLPPKNSPP